MCDFMRFSVLLTTLMVLIVAVNAVALNSNSNHVDLDTNGDSTLTLWFTAVQVASYAVNSQSDYIQTRVTPSSGNVEASETKSFQVRFSAPSCSQGTFYVTINLDLASSGIFERVSKIVEVNVARSRDCSPVIRSNPRSVYVSDSASSIQLSLMHVSNQFDPTQVNLVINALNGQSNIANGETVQLEVNLINRGATGLFEIDLIAPSELGATISEQSITLERSEVKKLTLLVKPQNALGRKYVSLQVTRSGQVVAVKDIYFDIGTENKLELTMPQVVKTSNCGAITVAGEVKNAGSAVESVSVSIPAVSTTSQFISLQPRESKNFAISADVSTLSQGNRKLEVKAASQRASTSSEVEFQIAQCVEGTYNYTVEVTNPGNETLQVIATVENVPSEWRVTPVTASIEPGKTKSLNVLVTTSGQWNEDVQPTMVVKDSNGNQLSREEALTPIRANAPISGLFLAGVFGLSGLQWIVVILFAALLIALMTARASKTKIA